MGFPPDVYPPSSDLPAVHKLAPTLCTRLQRTKEHDISQRIKYLKQTTQKYDQRQLKVKTIMQYEWHLPEVEKKQCESIAMIQVVKYNYNVEY